MARAPKKPAAKSAKVEKAVKEKADFGRPTKYDPSFCARVVELGQQGMSKFEIASDLGVDQSTLWAWTKEYTDFSNAIIRAKQEEQSWWERQGRENLLTDPKGKQINASVYNRQMANRFREDHGDRVVHSGPNDGPIETKDVSEPDQAARQILFALASALKKTSGDDAE